MKERCRRIYLFSKRQARVRGNLERKRYACFPCAEFSICKGEKPLPTTKRPIVVGIFKDEEKAKSALDILLDVGFSEDQLNIAIYEEGLINHHLFNDLVNIGLSAEEANYYVREFEAGRSIVLVRHDGRQSEAVNILILYGTRIHEYFKRGMSDAPHSLDEGQRDQYEFASSSNPSNKPLSLKIEKTAMEEEAAAEEMPAWMRILKDAGLEHLI